jgi:hypothetical protein
MEHGRKVITYGNERIFMTNGIWKEICNGDI